VVQLTSLFGVVVFLALARALSEKRRVFPWRTVIWGLGLQAALAALLLKTATGRHVFALANEAVTGLVRFAGQGSEFVFGPLALEGPMARVFPERPLVLAILLTSTIILVAALSSLLYHWGVLQRVVHAIAWVMRRAMGTSGAETLSAAANIFMGQTEAPLLIKPYLPRLTRSELLCVMTGGMATIAGGVAAVYAKLGADAGHPEMAGHLLTASAMNAPAALLIAKILLPETELSETAGRAAADPPRTTTNSLDALCRGASDGLMLALNVVAMLIAFVAVVALANHLLTWPQEALARARGSVGAEFTPVTLQTLLGWVNAPFAWLMGVPWADCATVGRALGERIVLNEFFGYLTLTGSAEALSPRGFVLGTYALCGFANFASVAIQVGGIGSLAPERRPDLARFGVRAMIGGLLAAYLTACVVGVLI
jgi:CNT family concentrative nucleoside transporter